LRPDAPRELPPIEPPAHWPENLDLRTEAELDLFCSLFSEAVNFVISLPTIQEKWDNPRTPKTEEDFRAAVTEGIKHSFSNRIGTGNDDDLTQRLKQASGWATGVYLRTLLKHEKLAGVLPASVKTTVLATQVQNEVSTRQAHHHVIHYRPRRQVRKKPTKPPEDIIL